MARLSNFLGFRLEILGVSRTAGGEKAGTVAIRILEVADMKGFENPVAVVAIRTWRDRAAGRGVPFGGPLSVLARKFRASPIIS